ncbi:acyl-CoA dehydrogenase [Streptomyces sp. NWU339]|uniref:acyl-CoA dehydrogenase family protein n=1 Tax=Streptomyces sp. NWU339 TaxID=2185284 RepID=UPI000D674531|nr:acyl-CoA dehydrogenase family protein [Streptomyces sp. NWU339]PWI10430.1 acyl-CoA dehydrogenase [Streptomyces sp. NWU339]
MDDDDRRLLIDSLSQAVAAAGPGGLHDAVTEFGWHELLAEEPAVAVSSLAALQGEHLTDTSLLDDVVLAAAGIDGPARVVYPDLPGSEPSARVEKAALSITGVVASGDGDRFVVPALRGDEIVIVVVTGALDDPKAATSGLDPDSGWHRVEAELDLSGADVVVGEDAAARWQAMRSAGHRALAHELTAIGRRMLVAAVDHVGTREQFGHKLGSFQAVKHALADVRVWQECAGLAADAAWEDGLPESAQLAKILAGRFVRTAAANCQQVLGGMGFTWEHEFHRYLRRALVLEPLLGSAAHLRTGLGARLRAGGVPRLAPL